MKIIVFFFSFDKAQGRRGRQGDVGVETWAVTEIYVRDRF
jgi:hypothetical protein